MVYNSYVAKPNIQSSLYSVCTCAALVVMLSGVVFSLISAGVLGLWVGIEVNFLGAICFMSGVYEEESESVINYFIIQVVGSCFLLLGLLIIIYSRYLLIMESFILLGVCINLGIFPFHFWVPGVISSLSWFSCFVVSVVQKVAPLWLLSNFILSIGGVGVMEVLAILTSIIGCVGGLGILNYRALIGYSSLVHLGFLIILCLTEVSLFWGYLIIYGVLNCGVIWSLWSVGIYCYSDLIQEGDMNHYSNLWWVSLYLFSLAGIPPFTGIFLKVYFLVNCWAFAPLGCALCVISSAVSIYFYMGVVMETLIYWGNSTCSVFSWNNEEGISKVALVSIFINVVVSYPLFLACGI